MYKCPNCQKETETVNTFSLCQQTATIDKNGFIKIIIESSSSKIPLKNYFSNETLSFFRAENARKKLYEEIRKRGYDPRRIIIMEQRSLVQGPDYYPGDDVNSVVFEKYQYIKIIPAGLVGK